MNTSTEQKAAAIPQRPPALASGTILVVDDNDGNRDALSRRLIRRGYTVATAADGPKTLAILAEKQFDLVLLDVMMPGMSGLEVLETIRQTRSPTDLPVIMATAKDESEDIVKALGLGANDYVTKPLDFAVVAARIQTQLTLKRSIEQIIALEHNLNLRNVELEAANAKLCANAEQKQRELETAAQVQAAFLPDPKATYPGVKVFWSFEPCQELAGDALNAFSIDEESIAFYVLDVSGHGVAAALLAVAATRALSTVEGPDTIVMSTPAARHPSVPLSPARVADQLNRRFSWNSSGQFLTMFYAVLNVRTRELTYVSAGHPAAIRVPRYSPPVPLEGGGLPIGIGEAYSQHTVRLDLGDRLYLYSDGVTETMNAERELFGVHKLIAALDDNKSVELDQVIASLMTSLKQWRQGAPLRDDVSILAIECLDGPE